MRLVARIFLVVAIGTTAGCSSMLIGSGGGSSSAPIGAETRTGSTRTSDNELSQAVLRAFARDPQLADERLFAVARSGVVTLSGTVGDFEARDQAVAVAGNTSGVVSVRNQIAVNSNR